MIATNSNSIVCCTVGITSFVFVIYRIELCLLNCRVISAETIDIIVTSLYAVKKVLGCNISAAITNYVACVILLLV